jgi:hypothetical protein
VKRVLFALAIVGGSAAASAALAACGSSGQAPDDADANLVLTADFNAVGCPAMAMPDGASGGSGTLRGPGVAASVCNVGVNFDPPTSDNFDTLEFGFTNATSVFDSPAGANGLVFSGLVSVVVQAAPYVPGTYGGNGGILGVSYDLPIPPGLNCEAGVAPSCPPGCGFACAGASCTPCVPAPTIVSYTSGRWTLELTSADPHGKFAAELYGPDGGSPAATLAVAF